MVRIKTEGFNNSILISGSRKSRSGSFGGSPSYIIFLARFNFHSFLIK